MGSKARKARAKFDKLADLNAAPDKGAARKEKLRMASSWSNRGDLAGDYHKKVTPAQASAQGVFSAAKLRAHRITTI